MPSRGAKRSERGFSIVETVIALAIIGGALVAVERSVTSAGAAGTLAAQHSTAANLLSADIAQLEAMPFANLQAGLNPTADPLTGDPNIVSGGPTGYELKLNNASIPTSNPSASQPPLVPHISSVTEGITYHVATYPTVSSSTPSLVTVTVVVSWTAPNGKTASLTGESELTLP